MKFFRRLLSLESLFVFLVVCGAGFLRLYRIGDYLTFLGDEGRDVLVVRNILLGDLTLLGPRASAGDFFLGPIYYYFMAPFLWLWNFDPIGPAIMIGIIGTVTVWLIYFVGKQFFGSTASLFAAALYSVSPVVIAYSRSSWNPNPMPFFSLVVLFLLYKAVAEEKRRLYILIGVLFGITMQLHYLATFLGVIVLIYLFIAHWMRARKRVFPSMLHPLSRMSIGFLIGFSPFLAFEVRHGFPNFRTILNFIFTNTFSSSYKTGMAFQDVLGNVFFRLFGRLITRFPPPEQVSVQTNQGIALWYYATVILAIVSTGIFAWQFYKYYTKKDEKKILQYSLIALWFFLGIILFGFYKKPIHDYYFGFMFPAPFLLLGNALATIVKSKRLNIIGVVLGLFAFSWLLFFNLKGAPFLSSPNRQKDQVKMIAEFVMEKAGGKPFNFALLTKGNSDHAYRYFFELAGRPPVTIENETIDPMRKTVTDQLLIICEDTSCKPLGNSLWEVAGFGRAEIVDEWRVSVVKVYKLSRYTGE
ncbi:MAG: glycosyltransferase family 39 protein [Candidatus Levybacteria bacterium]|nr:glycosyltransferase family 39 protein [Candidatus Levybacteria bacterium]